MLQPIVVRGGGDIATGTIVRLSKAGYRVIVLECEYPTAIRRGASFSDLIYKCRAEGRSAAVTIEGVTMHMAENVREAYDQAAPLRPYMLIDEGGISISQLKPDILVDAILAKRNIGTGIDMAPLTIALGPGFTAGRDVHYVIETMRGHRLGRIISEGQALPNTGVPGIIGGYGKERVIHAPAAGELHILSDISDTVTEGQTIAEIDSADGCVEVKATLTGVLRGILPDGFRVFSGMKMADIDPRLEQVQNCYSISDKSRCIAGSVLELVCGYEKGMVGNSRYE